MVEHTLLKVNPIETSKTYTKDDLWSVVISRLILLAQLYLKYLYTTCILQQNVVISYHHYGSCSLEYYLLSIQPFTGSKTAMVQTHSSNLEVWYKKV